MGFVLLCRVSGRWRGLDVMFPVWEYYFREDHQTIHAGQIRHGKSNGEARDRPMG
jgi:hypothetical protein